MAESRRPRILDLFSGAGGAAMGYHRAGFDVVGADIAPQPRYPFEFFQADALEFLTWPLTEFDAIHASPPCQAYSTAQRISCNLHPELVDQTRELLEQTGLPYVIENVVGAPLRDPVTLCGAMFPELRVYRHRLFEANFPLTVPEHPEHVVPQTKMGRPPKEGEFMHVVGNFSCAKCGREAMDIPWMTRNELSESIPPAYTEFIGRQLLAHIKENPSVEDRIAA